MKATILVLAAVLGISTFASAQDSLNVTKLGNLAVWRGDALSAAIIPGNRLAVALGAWGSGTRFLDITDPAHMRETHMVPVDGVGDMAVTATGFVAATYEGIEIVSTNPVPVVVGRIDFSGGATAVAVTGSYAYVGGWTDTLRILDISDVSSPRIVGVYPSGWPSLATRIVSRSNVLYVVQWDVGGNRGRLLTLDISNPEAPVRLDALYGFHAPQDIALEDNVAYVADVAELKIADVANPADLTMLPPYDYWYLDEGEIRYFTVTQLHLVSNRLRALGLRLLSELTFIAGDPATLFMQWVYDDLPEEICCMAIPFAEPVYLVERRGSVLAIQDGVEIGEFNPLGDVACGVAVEGSFAYVANRTTGLSIVNLLSPAAPSEIGLWDTPGEARDVVVRAAHAYVADSTGGLRIIEVYDPYQPQEVGFFDPPNIAVNGVALQGNHAYLACDAGLIIVNIANPRAPYQTGFWDYPGAGTKVAVNGRFAYVVANGLQVIDVQDPYNPNGINVYNSGVTDLAIVGNLAYAATWYSKMEVLDITDPYQIRRLGLCDLGYGPYADRPNSIAVSGDYACVTRGRNTFQVIRLTDPAHPQVVGWIRTAGYTRDVAITGATALVAGHTALELFDFGAAMRCLALCPPGVRSEGESCPNQPDNVNGGCDGYNWVFSAITNSDQVYGRFHATTGPYGVTDEDWYRLEMTAEESLRVCLQSQVPARLRLVAAGTGTTGCVGDYVMAAATTGSCAPATCIGRVLQPGTYFIAISPEVSGDIPCSNYLLSTTALPFESGAACVADFELEAPGTLSGNSTGGGDDCPVNPGDEQVILVTIPYPGNWTFSLCDNATNFDTWLDLRDACCGNLIASNNNTCDSRSRLTAVPLDPGQYYLHIEGFYTSGTGAWALTVNGAACVPQNVVTLTPGPQPNSQCVSLCAGSTTLLVVTSDHPESQPVVEAVPSCHPDYGSCDEPACPTPWFNYDPDGWTFSNHRWTNFLNCYQSGCACITIQPPVGGGDEPGDLCASALPLTVPGSATGSTCGFADQYDAVCFNGGGTAPDVVYTYWSPLHQLVSFSLCDGAAGFDTKLYVHESSCQEAPLYCSDDACTAAGDSVPRTAHLECVELLANTTYYIVVDGNGSECGSYTLQAQPCAPVCADCPWGSRTEDEYCPVFPDTVNGGCGSGTPRFTTIRRNDVLCGTLAAGQGDPDVRDEDWFEVSVAEQESLSVCVRAEFPCSLTVWRSVDGCLDRSVVAQLAIAPCGENACVSYTGTAATLYLALVPTEPLLACGDYILYTSSPPRPPACVSDLTIHLAPDTGAITLNWSRVGGADGYMVFRSESAETVFDPASFLAFTEDTLFVCSELEADTAAVRFFGVKTFVSPGFLNGASVFPGVAREREGVQRRDSRQHGSDRPRSRWEIQRNNP